jgi:hypothetical protein
MQAVTRETKSLVIDAASICASSGRRSVSSAK